MSLKTKDRNLSWDGNEDQQQYIGRKKQNRSSFLYMISPITLSILSSYVLGMPWWIIVVIQLVLTGIVRTFPITGNIIIAVYSLFAMQNLIEQYKTWFVIVYLALFVMQILLCTFWGYVYGISRRMQ